jgi:hypothetical protein
MAAKSDWKIAIAKPSNPAKQASNRALFAMILWYATSNKAVSIEQAPLGTGTSIVPGKAKLANYANQFGVLATPANFKAAVAWLENVITTRPAIQSYLVTDIASGNAIQANINVGVAFKIVEQTFNALIQDKALNGGNYDPNDNCDFMDILSIVPPPSKKTTTKTTATKTTKTVPKKATKSVTKKAAKKK